MVDDQGHGPFRELGTDIHRDADGARPCGERRYAGVRGEGCLGTESRPPAAPPDRAPASLANLGAELE